MQPISQYIIKRYRKILLLLLFVSLSAITYGQQKFSEGKITYSIEVTKAGSLNAKTADMIEDGKLTYNFKNHLFRSDLALSSSTHINIYNSKNNTGLSLIRSKSGKNYLVEMSASDLKKESKKYEGLTFSFTKDKKKIAGYTCYKAIGALQNGEQFVVYYTKALQPVYPNYNPRFKGINGIPLQFQFNIDKANAQLTMTATKVKKGFQSSELFKTPTSGYRALSYEQLRKLRGKE